MNENKLNEDSLMGVATKPLIISIMDRLCQAKLRADAAILSIFTNLQVALEGSPSSQEEDDSDRSEL